MDRYIYCPICGAKGVASTFGLSVLIAAVGSGEIPCVCAQCGATWTEHMEAENEPGTD